jgi:hypothetical protein
MKKIVRLTESDLQRIVKRVIRESMINELGGMDDGHPFSGSMNFNDLTPEERERVNKYYRVGDEVVDNSYSEIDSELGDDFEDDSYSELEPDEIEPDWLGDTKRLGWMNPNRF